MPSTAMREIFSEPEEKIMEMVVMNTMRTILMFPKKHVLERIGEKKSTVGTLLHTTLVQRNVINITMA